MQQSANPSETSAGRRGDRGRIEVEKAVKVVAVLATVNNRGETLAEVAHDARNMVTALGLYCDLLDEPGVLATPFAHYSQELRMVAAASRRLVEKLVALDARAASRGAHPGDCPGVGAHAPDPFPGSCPDPGPNLRPNPGSNLGIDSGACFAPLPELNPARTRDSSWRTDLLPALPVPNLAAELIANRNLLAALAGPAIALTVDAQGGAQPVRLTTEDLTRVLVNLVKNASEAMPSGGRIHFSLVERPAASGTLPSVTLAIEDNGPGVPAEAIEKIFSPGFTTHGRAGSGPGNVLWAHRGLGLSITRSIVEAAGGRISASNRPQGGARFSIELPVRKTGYQPLASGS
jgi:signal transduction histidine kinase